MRDSPLLLSHAGKTTVAGSLPRQLAAFQQRNLAMNKNRLVSCAAVGALVLGALSSMPTIADD